MGVGVCVQRTGVGRVVVRACSRECAGVCVHTCVWSGRGQTGEWETMSKRGAETAMPAGGRAGAPAGDRSGFGAGTVPHTHRAYSPTVGCHIRTGLDFSVSAA